MMVELEKTKRVNTEAKKIIEGYVLQEEVVRRDIQTMKESMTMYKEQLASTVLEKDNVNRELEDTLVALQHEKNQNLALHEQLSILKGKLPQSEKSSTAPPCSFEEFISMKREIKLLKLEIMNIRGATERQERGKIQVPLKEVKDPQLRLSLKKSSSGSGKI